MMRSFDVPTLPVDLTAAIERAGYYPALVGDVVAAALAGEQVRSHLVHLETTFDRDVIRRHVTVLVLTPSRLVIAHADDHADEAAGAGSGDAAGAGVGAGVDAGGGAHAAALAQEVATATTESIPLSAVRGVMLTHVVSDPQNYVPGSLGRELTLTLGWGAVSRVDLLPATCGDPGCDADHGYDGTISSDDIALRVSATADGDAALQQALSFAHDLSAALGQ
ncbi:DUF5998 family protein [Knoellia subterranea]|uniref:Phosphodiesterase n=1 Tax=Knoellia subterranea KCTC 19937 TaxID=1385521 RepID=A0A0A0JSF0_9MICO|nr:DUF5998 family protein [Knoellia subterranea]KGN38516.1 phosphodiesterase [Knoellia subterranea KCTC 19937]